MYFMVLAYHFLMFYGVFLLMISWASGATAGIPHLAFLLFGLGVPMGGWLLAPFVPALSLAVPFSLGVMVLWSILQDLSGDSVERAMWNQDLAGARRMLEVDPKNAAAYWTRGKVYEAQGRRRAALENYERAHKLSDRTVTAPEISDIRERLGAPKGRRIFRGLAIPAFVDELGLERLALAASLPFILWNWLAAANLISVMLTVNWLKNRQT